MSPLVLGLLAGVVNFGILLFNVGLTQWEPIAAAGISDDGSTRTSSRTTASS